MTYTYIKYDVPGFYVELDAQLDENLYSNIGTKWEDFLDNKWVRLKPAQVAFRDEHPEASVGEVWRKEPDPETVRTLEQAKEEKTGEIERYDTSEAVNSFTVNGIPAWFSVEQRLNYKQSIEAARTLGKDKVNFFIGDILLEIGVERAEQLLALLQDYADTAYIVTKQHKIAVNALESIGEVDAYDHTAGYPEKLAITLE